MRDVPGLLVGFLFLKRPYYAPNIKKRNTVKILFYSLAKIQQNKPALSFSLNKSRGDRADAKKTP